MTTEQTHPESLSSTCRVLDASGLDYRHLSRFGEDCIQLENAAKRAIISLLGAQILSWSTQHGQDPLWVTEESRHVAGSPIRGGIPVCWPWFGTPPHPFEGPSHGPGRRRRWQLVAAQPTANGFSLRFRLALESPQLEADYHVDVSDSLTLVLATTNRDRNPLPVAPAFHPYFRIASLASTRLRLDAPAAVTDRLTGDSLHDCAHWQFKDDETEVQWPWHNATLETGAFELRLESDTATHCVAWNPGPQKTCDIRDLAEHAFREFVCVEPAQLDPPAWLQPGATQTLSLRIGPA